MRRSTPGQVCQLLFLLLLQLLRPVERLEGGGLGSAELGRRSRPGHTESGQRPRSLPTDILYD